MIVAFLFYDMENVMRVKRGIIAFLLSYIVITCIFFSVGIIGGDLSLFQGDDFQQYISFIFNFNRIIRGDSSIWYSFSNYLGSGNILTVAYYCLSPFNILFLLFGDNIYIAYYLIVAIKISLAALSFYFFITVLCKSNRFYYVIAAVFYALSGVVVTWYFNIMWLDAVYILPLLIAYIIKYIDKGGVFGLIVTYVYLFLTNFYMGFIVGIFSACFFVSYLLYKESYVFKEKILYYLKKGIGFISIVLLSAGVCAGLLLPTAGFLSEHMAHDNIEFEALIVNFFDIINSMFLGEFQTMDNQVPILYAGLPTMAIAFFFFFNKKVDSSKKIFWGGLLLFYTIGMICLPLYKFLHAFDYPNYYGYRFSFVIVFLLISISCVAIEYIDENSYLFFKWFIIGAAFFYSFMMTFQNIFFAGKRLNDQTGLIINIVLMIAWLLVFLYCYSKREAGANRIRCKILCISLAIFELVINGYICIKNTDFVNLEKSFINGWYFAEKEVIENISSDDDFYRVYVNNEINTNAGQMFGYNGLNTFSSADNYTLRMALCRLGESTSNRYTRSNCSVPVFDSLFNVKYYVDMPDYQKYIYSNSDSNNYEPAIVTENQYSLSLGYMVAPDILEYYFTSNAFDNLNNLCSAMTGIDCEIFEKIILDNDDYVLMNYEMEEIEGRLYFDRISSLYDGESGMAIMLDDYSDNRYVEFSYNLPGSYNSFPTVYTDENGDYHSKLLAEGGVYKMGRINDYNYIKTAFTGANPPGFFINSINVAEYNEEEFAPVYDELSKNLFEIIKNDDDYIIGKVVATEDKPYLFTTIPYDPEWQIYVDGKPIKKLFRVVGEAFMAIELDPGEHIVSFEYVEKWSNEGAIISLLSVTVFCILILFALLLKKRKTTDDDSKL